MSDLPMIISVDDHIVEPPHLWQEWLPRKFRERGPRVERRGVGAMRHVGGGRYEHTWDPSGPQADVWVFEDLVYVHKRHVAAAGYSRDEMTMTPMTYDEMRPGCYDPKARVKDMLDNHVDGSLCFPTFPRFCGQTFTENGDRELGLACIEAYNNYMVDEWCGDSNGVLIPLIIVPLWDAELAAAEVRRNAARGVHAVTFSEIPPHLGLPSIHSGEWDPFFRACEETATTINMHIGSSSRMPATSSDAPDGVAATLSFNNAMASLADWLFSGKLVEFPELKLAYSEGQIGWLPYVLERADAVWEDHRAWIGTKGLTPEPPSYYYRRNVFGCFFKDYHGVESRDKIGIDTITFETDYPHTDSTWPHTKKVAEEHLQGLTDEEKYKILRGNAIRMLSLDRV
ncbi:amidohydrolase family protein [Nocardioides sp. Bht2]|uniref:amidohydrolase family protein n=1 Tax=Nocardioides sp. Bht2 TaxID=3392297 RepID=UPI0039B6A45B